MSALFQRLSSIVALFVAVAFVASCSNPDVGPDFAEKARDLEAETFDCCFDPEKFYPAPLISVAIVLAEEVAPLVAGPVYEAYGGEKREGLLSGNTEAHELILSHLKPLDVLLRSNSSIGPTARTTPGRFGHALLYLGTEAELRAVGAWELPEVRPYHDDIRAGRIIAEATYPGVRMRTPGVAFSTDRVFAVRPTLSHTQRHQSIRRAFGLIGTPFDYTMAINPDLSRVSCTGYIDRVLTDVRLTRREAYGLTVVLPDDIAAQAIRGDRLDVVSYVVGTEDGHIRRSTLAAMVEIASFWGFAE